MPAPRKTPSPTAIYLGDAIIASGLTQREIAERVGFPKPNMLSMMKTGDSKVPIDRIPALAKVCGVDAEEFVAIAMREYHPEIWGVLTRTFGPALTFIERELLVAYDIACPAQEIYITEEVAEAVTALFLALKAAQEGSL